MRKGLGLNRDRAIRVSEVRKPLLRHNGLLAKNDLTLRPMQRSPLLHAALQCAQDGLVVMLRVLFLQVIKQGCTGQLRLIFQQRKQFCFPDRFQWIFSGAPVPLGVNPGFLC